MFAAKCVSSWLFVMRSYFEQVLLDVSRIRTMADAYRDAYLRKREHCPFCVRIAENAF